MEQELKRENVSIPYRELFGINPNYFNNKELIRLISYSRNNEEVSIYIPCCETGYVKDGTYPVLLKKRCKYGKLKMDIFDVQYLVMTTDFVEIYNKLIKDTDTKLKLKEETKSI